MKSDIEIARSIELKKIKQVAESIGIPREEVENYGMDYQSTKGTP